MAIRDCELIATVLTLGGNFVDSPEKIIYGFAKVVLMDEGSLDSLLDSKSIAELEEARKVIAKKNLDAKLMKSGFSQVFPFVAPKGERANEYARFVDLLDTDEDISPADLLERAIELSVIPVVTVFAMGNSMDDVFEFAEKAKAQRKADEASEETKASGKASKASGDGRDSSKSGSEASSGAGKNSSKDSREASGDGKDSSKPDKSPSAPDRGSSKPDKKKGIDLSDIDFGKTGKNSANTQVMPEAEADEDLATLSKQCSDLSRALMEKIKGQDRAIMKFVQGIFQSEISKNDENRKTPRTYFFFFGPPGVGKTHLAETAAEFLGRPSQVFDMSSYSDHQSGNILIGATEEYGGREGELVKFVRENPKSILIFDEIEKAHINVIRLFLQILSSSKLRSPKSGKDVSFKETIIIFTSNVGKELYEDRSVNLSTLPERVVVDAVKNEKNAMGQPVLPPEICSRIASGNTIVFDHLNIRFLTDLVTESFEKMRDSFGKNQNCNITYADKLPLLFLFSRGGDIDARVATSQGANFIKNELFEFSRQLEKLPEEKRKISKIRMDIDWNGVDRQIMKLFENDAKAEILLLADETVRNALKLDESKYTVHYASDVKTATELLKQDISAVFVDPFFGRKDSESTLSIADYNTEGISFFRNVVATDAGLPVYLIERGNGMTDVDKKTFLQEGAADTVAFRDDLPDYFSRRVQAIIDIVYMENSSIRFTQQGFVIAYRTKQIVDEDGTGTILFYDLAKRQAIDVANRGSVLSEAERPKEKFSDVIGAKTAKETLAFYVDFLKNPKKHLVEGHKMPKGVLLYGPPGTGKTMLARAMAGESDVTFVSTSAAEFKDKYVGESEANVRRAFRRARKYAPSILFIDEIDAIGKKRTGSEFSSTTESMLNALLTEMDGFNVDSKRPVFVLAATNYGVSSEDKGVAELDPALVRRFDKPVYVDLPTKDERLQYLELMAKKKKMTGLTPEGMKNFAERSTGKSIAILQNVIETAYEIAYKQGRSANDKDLIDAWEQLIYGDERESTPEHYRSVAIHETGHAIVSHLSGDTPSFITIQARGDHGGYMEHAHDEQKGTYTRDELVGRIRTSLAGRAAEMVYYGKDHALNTGASSDLQHATNIAFSLLSRYGMEEGSLVSLSRDEIMKSNLAADYIKRVNDMLVEEMTNTVRIIEENRKVIDAIVQALLENNHLTTAEFVALVEEKK